MKESEIRQKVRCGACHGKLSGRLNAVVLNYKATWKYPVGGNVLTDEESLACAILCDACVDKNAPILEAVEFGAEGPVYHPVEGLEKI